MMKYTYNGTEERVFPTLGITVKPGQEFDAPENFRAADVTPAGAKVAPKPQAPTQSAASDLKAGE